MNPAPRTIHTLLLALGVLALSCNPGAAQMATPASAGSIIGASPLGVPGATSTVGPVGIPLGSTELSPGGLSPGPSDVTTNNSFCAGSGISGSAAPSTFDGGGMNTNTTGSSMTSSCGAGGTASGTTASASSLSGSNAGPAPGVAGVQSVPLGATELDNAGVSPLVTTPSVSGSCDASSSALPGSSAVTDATGFGSITGC